MKMLNDRTTLKQIADRAAVSVSTVSLVLSGNAVRKRVSTNAIERVKQAAADLDYSPNLLVRSIQKGRTEVIAFMSGFRQREMHDSYMGALMAEIERASGALRYDLLVACTFNRSPEETYQVLNGALSDGLVFFAPSIDDPLLPYLRHSRLPVVLCNGEDDEHRLSSVSDDVESGIRQIVDELLRLGHRRIGVVTNTRTCQRDAGLRTRLLLDSLQSRGVVVPPDFVIDSGNRKANDPPAIVSFYLHQEQPPTAIVCWHDRIGYEILDYCHEVGIRIPETFSLIGYDGLRWPSQSSHNLASVHVDISALAGRTISVLHGLIRQRRTEWTRETVPVQFRQGTTLAAVDKRGIGK